MNKRFRDFNCAVLVSAAAMAMAAPAWGQTTPQGDCQDFRVWAGIMGKKESHYVPTQGTGDTG